jgi:segregation and condensation protein A
MTAAYLVKQEKFEGPLELLLDLIEKEKLSITEISLSGVADEYIAHIRTLANIDPEELAEFLVVAAQLMLIKSRSLLPSLELSPEEEGSIEELEQRMREYQKIRELARELKKLEVLKNHILVREAFYGQNPIFYPPPSFSPNILRVSFAAFLAALPKIEKLAEEKIKKIISLEEKISHIRSFLSDRLERAFSEIIKGAAGKVDIIVSFLAILELAKQKFVDIRQEKLFEDIKIRKII